jgi:hypothetical protein
MSGSDRISFRCPGCGKRLKAKLKAAGSKVHCPNKVCGCVILVPERQSAADEPAESESVPSVMERDGRSDDEPGWFSRHWDRATSNKSDGQEFGLAAAIGYTVQGLVSLLFYFLMVKVEPESRVPLTLLVAIPAAILVALFVLDFFTGLFEIPVVGKMLRGLAYLVMVGPQLFALMNLFVALNPNIGQPTRDRIVGFVLGAVVCFANLIGGGTLSKRAEESK